VEPAVDFYLPGVGEAGLSGLVEPVADLYLPGIGEAGLSGLVEPAADLSLLTDPSDLPTLSSTVNMDVRTAKNISCSQRSLDCSTVQSYCYAKDC